MYGPFLLSWCSILSKLRNVTDRSCFKSTGVWGKGFWILSNYFNFNICIHALPGLRESGSSHVFIHHRRCPGSEENTLFSIPHEANWSCSFPGWLSILVFINRQIWNNKTGLDTCQKNTSDVILMLVKREEEMSSFGSGLRESSGTLNRCIGLGQQFKP